jgi:hypothetical protein
MMAALVRVEFFPTPTRLTLVPMEQVARRLFANTELQRLHVWYQGEPIGTCQLSISPRAHLNGPESPAGITKPTAYYVHFIMRRLRLQILGVPSQFNLDSKAWFDQRYELRYYDLITAVGESHVDIHGDNDSKKLAMDFNLGDGPQSKQFDYAQLNNPAALESLGVPGLPSLAGMALPSGGRQSTGQLMPVIHAYDDRIEISGTRQHAYLIECKSDQNPGLWAKAWIDDEGNVLRVETSLGLTLNSGSMDNFASGRPSSAKTISETRPLR